MTVYKLADLDKWAAKNEKRMDIVAKAATNDLFALGSRTKAGKTRGGTIIAGYVPRDLGFLAASAVSGLNGSTSLTGENAYVMAIANMKAGDSAQLGWTAVYARKLHYDGWLWVDSAANQWQQIVRDVIKRAKALQL